MDSSGLQSRDSDAPRTGEVIAGLSDRWSLQVVCSLADGGGRVNDLLKTLRGIPRTILLSALQRLERDGLVVQAASSPPASGRLYVLSPLGQSLLSCAAPLVEWASAHRLAIAASRAEFDRRAAAGARGVSPRRGTGDG